MNLHNFQEEFNNLITITSQVMHLPETAIEKDYYIVLLLKKLEQSHYADSCVFKGGTSLSKCYPGSIERFSEDIDLTYIGMDLSDKKCEKIIKEIEKVITCNVETEKIIAERSSRSKSMYVWFGNRENKIKLEIGSNVRPDPYSKKTFKSYIHEYLEKCNEKEDIARFNLKEVTLNVLEIERTFVDKLMSVKRHAICGSINNKVRHIYDVARLYVLPEIKEFLSDKKLLKNLITLTKQTDSFYLKKRNISEEYDPLGAYDFISWKHYLDDSVRFIYENLHNTLLYTDEKQNFDDAIAIFEEIDNILKSIEE